MENCYESDSSQFDSNHILLCPQLSSSHLTVLPWKPGKASKHPHKLHIASRDPKSPIQPVFPELSWYPTMWSTAKSSKSQRHSVSKSSKSSPETSRTTKASSKLTESPPSNDNDQAVVKQQGPDPLPNMASFLHGMKRKSLLKNSSSTIIAIVERDDVKDLVKLIEDKKKKIGTFINPFNIGRSSSKHFTLC